jgi:hypothetical protein
VLGATLHKLVHSIRKKLTRWEAMYALPPSTYNCWQNYLLMHTWGVKTDEISVKQGQSCTVKFYNVKCFSMGTGTATQQHNNFRHSSSALTPNCQLLFVTQHLTIISTIYCHTHFLIMFNLRISEKCEYSFSHCLYTALWAVLKPIFGDDFIGKIATNLQVVRHFINS